MYETDLSVTGRSVFVLGMCHLSMKCAFCRDCDVDELKPGKLYSEKRGIDMEIITWVLNVLWTILKAVVYLLSVLFKLQWQGILCCFILALILLFYFASSDHKGLRGICDMIAMLFVFKPFFWIVHGLYCRKYNIREGE